MVLVKPGQSPATYEPTPRQMAELADADVFFAVGVPYERGVLPRLAASIPALKIVRTQEGIDFLPASPAHESDGHDHGDHDPHIWLDPRLAKRIAATMRDELIRLDPSHATIFRDNFDRLAQQLDSLYQEIRELLLPYHGRHFAAYHPAWGYFARAFGVVQLEIAIGGKVPGPREIAGLLDDVKQFDLRGLIVQPQFRSSSLTPWPATMNRTSCT
jgi:zinc transport system substrate-binding protein